MVLMSKEKDLLDMFEIITTAIEIHGNEEEFFRRSSNASTNEAAKALFLEMADDIGQYREKLETRRQKIRDELRNLQTP
jgi:hypothetical protein